MSWPPVQFPWETPPSRARATKSFKLPTARANQAPVKPSNSYYKKGFTTSRMSTSTTSAAMRYKQGLSNATHTGTNWFRRVPPGSPKVSNTAPSYQQGRVINRSTATTLATRGAVGLGVIKQGGGGMGQFSK